jgi:hypothetical protein
MLKHNKEENKEELIIAGKILVLILQSKGAMSLGERNVSKYFDVNLKMKDGKI